MKNLIIIKSGLQNVISAIWMLKFILKIVCWHIFKDFLAKGHYENPGKLYFMN
jgi:hypothetical protein